MMNSKLDVLKKRPDILNQRLDNIIRPAKIEQFAILLHKVKCFHTMPLFKIGCKEDYLRLKLPDNYSNQYWDSGQLNFIYKFYESEILEAFVNILKTKYHEQRYDKTIESTLNESRLIMERFVENYESGIKEEINFDLEKIFLEMAEDDGFYHLLPEKYFSYRKTEVERNAGKIGIMPVDILLVGATGVGKSTTINAVLKKNDALIGKGVGPETIELSSYILNNNIRFWDTPGLGDGVKRDQEHSKKIVDLLYKTYESNGKKYGFIDMVLILIEGINRDMGTTYQLINNVILPNFPKDRVIFAINQCDVAMKGHHWSQEKKAPEKELKKYLENQVDSIQRRIQEATGILIKRPIYYSAEYKYHIGALMDLIIDNIPNSKRCIY